MNFLTQRFLLHSSSLIKRCKLTNTNSSIYQMYKHGSSLSSTPEIVQEDLETISISNEINLTHIDKEAVTENDPKKLQDLEMLLSTLNKLMLRKSLQLPAEIDTTNWRYILSLPTLTKRVKYMEYLFQKEIRKQVKKKKKLESREELLQFREKKKLEPKPVYTTSSPPSYGLQRTSIFHRIYESHMHKFFEYQLYCRRDCSPTIVMDCSFESVMTMREIKSAARQLALSWCANRDNLKPVNLMLCNLSKEKPLYKEIKEMSSLADDDALHSHLHTNASYTELFPKEDLVYLSPHAVDTMEKYDPSKIYIIGVLVDVAMPDPLSLAKANREGIKTMKFPLNNYLNWKNGVKCLNMNHVFKIMLDVRNGCSWQDAFNRHISFKLKENQPDEKKDEDIALSALTIKRMYLKNKVHELILKEIQ